MKQDALWKAVKILPTDYTDYGGEVERWKDPTLAPMRARSKNISELGSKS